MNDENKFRAVNFCTCSKCSSTWWANPTDGVIIERTICPCCGIDSVRCEAYGKDVLDKLLEQLPALVEMLPTLVNAYMDSLDA